MGKIHERIKELRISKNLKQSDIAKAAGISNTAYGKIENGITESISIEFGKVIARMLQVPFTELFEIDEGNNAEIKELEDQIKQLKTHIYHMEATASLTKTLNETHNKTLIELEQLRQFTYLSELFELLDDDLFVRHNQDFLENESLLSRFSFKTIKKYHDYYGKKATSEIFKFIDINKFKKSPIVTRLTGTKGGTEIFSKEEIIEWVMNEKKNLR
jgi:transcriptional regulator with XRE-family HTH domain